MEEYSSKQDNINAGGDVAGRDIHKHVYSPGKQTHMGALIERFKVERANDSLFESMVEKLQAYCEPIDDGAIVGVEAKLDAGGFDEQFIEFAQATKEFYSKKIAMHQHYEAAQMIHACLLAKIYSIFHNKISPLIKNGKSQTEILSAVETEIIDYIESFLEENVLELFADEINGALYFLTGNCYIKWV